MLKRGLCHLLISARWRWFFFRRRSTILTIVGFIVLILWAKVILTPDTRDKPVVFVIRNGNVVPAHRIFTQPPGPVDFERQNRSDLFVRLLGNKVKHSMRLAGGLVTNCMLPTLDLSHDSNQFAFRDMPPLRCSGKRMFFIQNGKFVLNKSVVRDPRRFESCSFFQVKNHDDDFYFYSQPIVKKVWPFDDVPVEHDFVRIQCSVTGSLQAKQDMYAQHVPLQKQHNRFWNLFRWKREAEEESNEELDHENVPAKEGAPDQKQGHGDDNQYVENNNLLENDEMDTRDLYWNSEDADYYERNYPNLDSEKNEFDQFSVQITPKPEVFQRISRIMSASTHRHKKPSVLMLAVNSVSHLSFRRLLPQTYQYLKQVLGAVVLENYNVVGELTKDELIPLLTGMKEKDLPDVQTWKYNAETMDVYPFVWKEFQQQGYATLFAEDEPLKSVFNTGFYGFDKPPTDHYMRPLWQAVLGSEIQRSSPSFCTGDHASHQMMLQYVEDFFEAYHNVSRFAFAFFRELTSSTSINPVQHLDTDLLRFLQNLGRRKFLEDTVVIVFSDRGLNDYTMKSTVLAKMEERLPMMALAFPQEFRQLNPQAYANLVTNARRLTTPFDIHETLLDLLYPSRLSYRPPEENATAIMSLFEDIPVTRTCDECGIAPYWCTCLSHILLDPAEPFVKSAALQLLGYLNDQTQGVRQQCAGLGLQSIYRAHLVLPTWQVLKYTHADGEILRWTKYSSPFDLRVARLAIMLRTSPCNVLYEGTVFADFRNYTHYRYDVAPEEVRGLGVRKYHFKCLVGSAHVSSLKTFCCCRDFTAPQREGRVV